MKKIKENKKLLWIAIAVLCVAVGIGAFFAIKNQTGGDGAQLRTVNLKTTYLTLKYPKQYAKYLNYEELRSGADTEIVFTMIHDEIEAELFRLAITTEAPAEYVGYLSVDGQAKYVSVLIAGWDPEIFAEAQTDEELEKQEKTTELYYAMLDGVSTVMQSVYADAKFSIAKGVSESEKQERSMTYWKVSIPATIAVEEVEENGIYRATFSCDIGGKTVKLYTISLGDADAESVIGQFVVNGEGRIMSVEVYEAADMADADREIAYAMMDTINEVLEAIRADQNFREELTPAE